MISFGRLFRAQNSASMCQPGLLLDDGKHHHPKRGSGESTATETRQRKAPPPKKGERRESTTNQKEEGGGHHHPHALQTKPNQTKPNETEPNQTKPNQTKPSQAKPSQAKPPPHHSPLKKSKVELFSQLQLCKLSSYFSRKIRYFESCFGRMENMTNKNDCRVPALCPVRNFVLDTASGLCNT